MMRGMLLSLSETHVQRAGYGNLVRSST